MKISCDRKQLDEVLGVVVGATGARSSLPILSHLYLEATDDSLRLLGSDLEQWVECRVPAIVGEAGALTVNARLFAELVGSLTSDTISLELGERYQVLLQAGDSRYQLMGLPAEEYPQPQEVSAVNELVLPAKSFLDMVDSVEFAVSKEEARPTLTGIRLEYEGSRLRLVATDTHRLAVRDATLESGSAGSASAIVPLKAIQLLQKLPASETFTLRLGEHNAVFEGADSRVVSQLIAGQFPNYQRVIPQEYSRKWTLMVSEFRSALRRAALVARTNANKVRLHTEGEKLVITAQGNEGEAQERVDVIREGDDLEVAFNVRYILDVLDVLKSDGVVIELTESLRPAVFKPAEGDDYLCVIMPMAL